MSLSSDQHNILSIDEMKELLERIQANMLDHIHDCGAEKGSCVLPKRLTQAILRDIKKFVP